jgi:hypothetical protein
MEFAGAFTHGGLLFEWVCCFATTLLPRQKTAASSCHTSLQPVFMKLRDKSTIEPVFGIIKAAMGFRRFSLRGKVKVNLGMEAGEPELQPQAALPHGGGAATRLKRAAGSPKTARGASESKNKNRTDCARRFKAHSMVEQFATTVFLHAGYVINVDLSPTGC